MNAITKLEILLKQGPIIDQEMADLIPFYLNNVKLDRDNLRSSVSSKDFDGIKRTAHRIKGSALSYGFEAIDLLMREIETACSDKNIDEAEKRFSEFCNHLEQIEKITPLAK